MKKILVFLAFVLSVRIAQAADYQFRPQLHLQHAGSEGRAGVGAWAVVPDATARESKLFVVAGPLMKRSNYWVEVMAGGFVDETGRVDPTIDIRSSFGKKWKFFAEGLRTFETKRSSLIGTVTYPAGSRVRLGLEGESHWQGGGHKLLAGPRAEFLLAPRGKVKFVLAYQVADDGPDTLRGYLVLNF